MVPGAISGPGPGSGPVVDVVVVVVGVVSVDGLVGVIGVVAHHHICPAQRSRADGELLLGLVDFGTAVTVRFRARGSLMVMLAVLVAPHQHLQRRGEAGGGRRPGGPLLGHRRLGGVALRVAHDGDGLRLHLLLLRAPAPRRLVLRALAQDTEDLTVVGPLQGLAESRRRVPLRVGRLQDENQGKDARVRVEWRAKHA